MLISYEINIKGLNFMRNEIIISQLADDTTLFFKNEDQIPVALQTIDFFSKASGLKLNIKCELMSIHDYPLVSLHSIPVKNKVKYLGIIITKDLNSCEEYNFQSNI